MERRRRIPRSGFHRIHLWQKRLHRGTIVASYNGKSYDSPLLRTRYRLARLPDAITGLPHVDLLYPARRRYRGLYENCRLVTIERHVLKIVRENDLPGRRA